MENKLVGQLITDPIEQNRLVAEVKLKPSFKKAIEEIKKLTSFDEDNLNLIHIFQFDTLDENEEFTLTKVITFETPDRKVALDAFKVEQGDETFESFNANVTRAVDGIEIITGIQVVKGEVGVIFETELEGELAPLTVDLPVIENYRPGILLDSIEAEAWTDFCFYWNEKKKYYNHCGKSCGDHGKYGGGSMVNRIDGCCFNHDDCYYRNLKTKACCDYSLQRCASANRDVDYSMYYEIIAYYAKSASGCY
ncbi:hypothetical protein [Priestia aryabhattai]|uniref:hypothetical protein n=1 Tax=Priestia aryabhattai TaxID=412384 RepID=UPI001C8E6FE9|nr:hypothetical protein [Priestia aryabhattai]MBY0065224.1 hypothetical protein [Priestia aryabhattai]